MSENPKETAEDPMVTLFAVMSGDNKSQPAVPVRIRMPKSDAVRAVVHSVKGMTVSKPFSGFDANGNPYNIDVGYAIALTIEE